MLPVIAALPTMGTKLGTKSRALAITRSRSLSRALTVTKYMCVRVSR